MDKSNFELLGEQYASFMADMKPALFKEGDKVFDRNIMEVGVIVGLSYVHHQKFLATTQHRYDTLGYSGWRTEFFYDIYYENAPYTYLVSDSVIVEDAARNGIPLPPQECVPRAYFMSAPECVLELVDD